MKIIYLVTILLMVTFIQTTTTTTSAKFEAVHSDKDETDSYFKDLLLDSFNDIQVVFRAVIPNTSALIHSYSCETKDCQKNFIIPKNDVFYKLIFHRVQIDEGSGFVLNKSSLVEGGGLYVLWGINYLFFTSDNPVTWILCKDLSYCAALQSPESLLWYKGLLSYPTMAGIGSSVLLVIISISLACCLCHTTRKLKALQASGIASSKDHSKTTATSSLSGPPALPSSGPPADAYYYHNNTMNQNNKRGSIHNSENSLYGVVMRD